MCNNRCALFRTIYNMLDECLWMSNRPKMAWSFLLHSHLLPNKPRIEFEVGVKSKSSTAFCHCNNKISIYNMFTFYICINFFQSTKFYFWNVCAFFFIFCSCQDRVSAVVNIAIDLISYFINLCASFGWQSAHTIYCIKFIRLNQRAVVRHLKSIHVAEHIKSIGIDAMKFGMY